MLCGRSLNSFQLNAFSFLSHALPRHPCLNRPGKSLAFRAVATRCPLWRRYQPSTRERDVARNRRGLRDPLRWKQRIFPTEQRWEKYCRERLCECVFSSLLKEQLLLFALLVVTRDHFPRMPKLISPVLEIQWMLKPKCLYDMNVFEDPTQEIKIDLFRKISLWTIWLPKH